MFEARLDVGAPIDLHRQIPGFRSASEATRLDWSRKLIVPPGSYVVEAVDRSDPGTDGEYCSDGFFYQIVGPVRAWVRQNYLLAGGNPHWPWKLTRWLEPVDWGEIWIDYLRMRIEGRRPSIPIDDEPNEAMPAAPANGSVGVDEYGMPVKETGSFLPDFDDAFELIG